MSINSITIKNCKSIKNITIPLNKINCLIGENGTGKSNILKSIVYFYDKLTNDNDIICDIDDRINPYTNYLEVTFKYDFKDLINIAHKYSEKTINGNESDKQINPFFMNVLSYGNKYADDHKCLKVTLKRYKNGTQEWNIPYKVRGFLKNVFPIYFVDSRHLNLTNWENLWDMISDLSKIKINNHINLEKELEDLLENCYGKTFSKTLQYIAKELKNNDIGLDKFTLRQKFKAFYQIELGGNRFIHKNKKLDFFSDGINSYNYLRILISPPMS